MRLFIADDSEHLRTRLIEILSEIPNVEIVGDADNFNDAVVGIESLNPDLVILDIRMPGGNGIIILEKIRKIKQPPLIIIFTNYPYLQYRKRCMDAGADFFFYKAIEFEELVNQISVLAKSKRAHKEDH